MMKNEIRIENRKKRDLLSDNRAEEYAKRIFKTFFSTKEYAACNMLFAYVSFGKEVDTHEIINKAIADGKKVYIPRVEERGLGFYEINGMEGLIRSRYGILEPNPGIHKKYVGDNAETGKVMLVPGLAFDRTGNRIGYGAGYYDRFLGGYPKNEWVKIGLAYSFQVTDRIDADMDDVPVDFIITENELIDCRK
ncbi:MAG: 5-formyltetrahydrofolate cyclo-ligase [Clostridiales bacterium]|nr:5-formyltetrahydrofolate cyclo-ligase [Clostridiales bacterium]